MIVARFKTPNGGEIGVLGLTKENLEMLVKSEVLLLANVGMVLVYAEDDATLETSVRHRLADDGGRVPGGRVLGAREAHGALVKADRRWWNDGRLESEIDAFGRVELPEPVGFDGAPLPECHWWEACTTWTVPKSFLKTVPIMYKVNL